MLPARVARELRRSRARNSDWLARNDDKGVEGLKDNPRSKTPTLPMHSIGKW